MTVTNRRNRNLELFAFNITLSFISFRHWHFLVWI